MIKIKLCEAKMSVMRARLRTLAASTMEVFVKIFKEWKLSKTVKIAPS